MNERNEKSKEIILNIESYGHEYWGVEVVFGSPFYDDDTLLEMLADGKHELVIRKKDEV